jgi:hypothetical protein
MDVVGSRWSQVGHGLIVPGDDNRGARLGIRDHRRQRGLEVLNRDPFHGQYFIKNNP